MSLRFVLAAAVVIGLPALLQAQYNNRNPYGRQQIGAQPVEIQGTIQGVARGRIVVLDINGQTTWQVTILSATTTTPATKVQVTGATTADSLRSGLIVEFTAEIDSRGAIQDKVGELTVTSLTQQKQAGLFPADAAGMGDAQGGAVDKRAARGKTAAGAMTAGKYHIVGKLVVGRGGALSVQPGRGKLPFALADEPTIKIDMADFSVVSRGNTVSVSGFVMQNRQGVFAREIKVTLPEPPAVAKKKPAAKPEDKNPPESPKKGSDKDAGLPEPAPEK